MLKAIFQRPISVLMLFLTCIILGLITYNTLPVSLLPDIAIPEITIQIAGDNTSARELENTVVKPIRQHLMQVDRLRDVRSETHDGAAVVRLKFDYGTNTDLAFIEVNEKIDAAMNNLPRELRRPRVIKASATDLPVFYINLTLKSDSAFQPTDKNKFLALSELAENVVKRRIEQLPEVAMADMTGLMYKHLQIVPDRNTLASASITLGDIEAVLSANNIEPGSMAVREGHYQYNIKFSSLLRTVEDVQNIFLEKGGRIFRLKDLAAINILQQPESGLSLINGKRAITIGIIKQSDETMENLRNSLNITLEDLKHNQNDIEFTINRNQTELLDYTISNLQGNLLLGFILVSIVALLFLGDGKSPLIIGISMTTALVTTFIFFFLFKQSINIITLSGLILALGNMIDSSIVVTDIITQYRVQGYSLDDACEKGTTEVIIPIFSSTLTTIAVFVPLVFMSGIAGAIFYSEAFAVTVGMLVSYLSGIILLPVLYKLIYRVTPQRSRFSDILSCVQQKIDNVVFPFYDKGMLYVFKHRIIFFIVLFVSIPACVVLFNKIPKSTMPALDYTEAIVRLDWNENIHIDENTNRIYSLLKYLDPLSKEDACYVGQQQYLLEKDNELSISEAQLYFRTSGTGELAKLKVSLFDWINRHHPQAVISLSPPDNIFEKIFDTKEAEIVIQLYPKKSDETPSSINIRKTEATLFNITQKKAETIPFEQQYEIIPDKEKLLLYGVSQRDIYQTLKAAFRDNQVATLRSYQQYLPISISGRQQPIQQVLNETFISTYNSDHSQRLDIPIRSLITMSLGEDVKTIISGKSGEYIPFHYYNTGNPAALIKKTATAIKKEDLWHVNFEGNFFSNKKMIQELTIILFVSILLMYFILVAQFESFLQPLILLIEVPIDIAFALITIWATGNTLNLMSAIGIVVVIGVIINDSILKIDLINELRQQKSGISLKEIIHIAGIRRLRAIIMTSLTSLLSMVPILFAFDIGSELQKPLAIAMISTMSIGTLVSIFLIPLLYWQIYRKEERTSVQIHE